MSDLVRNAEDRFSGVAAQIILFATVMERTIHQLNGFKIDVIHYN